MVYQINKPIKLQLEHIQDTKIGYALKACALGTYSPPAVTLTK